MRACVSVSKKQLSVCVCVRVRTGGETHVVKKTSTPAFFFH